MYEVGRQLKRAIFGQVIHAILLVPSPEGGDLFVRTLSQMAIKIYYKDTLRALQGRTEENPLREITALQFVGDNHPNIMGQIECCADERNIYSIMRFCPGGELFDYIHDQGPMLENEARPMFKQLLNALNRM